MIPLLHHLKSILITRGLISESHSRCEHELHSQCSTSRPQIQSISKLDSNQTQFRNQTTLIRIVSTNLNLPSIESTLENPILTFLSLTFRCQWSKNTKLMILRMDFRSNREYITILHHYSTVLDHILQNQRIEWWFSILTWTILTRYEANHTKLIHKSRSTNVTNQLSRIFETKTKRMNNMIENRYMSIKVYVREIRWRNNWFRVIQI